MTAHFLTNRRIGTPETFAKALRPTIGLALGAGAARGFAHIGVITRLVEAGFGPDVIAGTSVGALAGGCFAAGKLDALTEFALSLNRRRIFSLMDFTWRGAGIITGERLARVLDHHLGQTRIEDLSIPFACIATELLTGHEIWLRDGPLAPAIRASYALPGLFGPVRIRHHWLIDGAVVNPTPVSACRALGARLVIAVNLNADAFTGTVIQATQEDCVAEDEHAHGPRPSLGAVMVAAFNISQNQLSHSRLAGDPPDIKITPRTSDIGLFAFNKAAQAIAAGREAAERMLPDIEAAVLGLERNTGA
jgi:NTE family protein